mmetsp:Transcript_2797/g.3163  ORF Transcript_2797/g.3163 Transcript_2797/m.3163 type:complete len:115 (-) Transcript_2797:111-455(-)
MTGKLGVELECSEEAQHQGYDSTTRTCCKWAAKSWLPTPNFTSQGLSIRKMTVSWGSGLCMYTYKNMRHMNITNTTRMRAVFVCMRYRDIMSGVQARFEEGMIRDKYTCTDMYY